MIANFDFFCLDGYALLSISSCISVQFLQSVRRDNDLDLKINNFLSVFCLHFQLRTFLITLMGQPLLKYILFILNSTFRDLFFVWGFFGLFWRSHTKVNFGLVLFPPVI